MDKPIITLTTDFGNDAFAIAQIKAVIYGISPQTNVIECASNVASFNLIEGAFILSEISQYFSWAIHVGVVDPGVGSARKPLIIETKRGFFVGPDNGLLIPAAKKSDLIRVYEIDPGALGKVKISNTFHGRDVFSRVAALLSKGIPAKNLSKCEIKEWHDLEILPNQIVFIDPYGNIKINNSAEYRLGQKLKFRLSGKDNSDCWQGEAAFCRTFSDVGRGDYLFYLGSNWNLELAVNFGSAAQVLDAQVGDIIEIE